MGKWDFLRGKYPKMPVEAEWLAKVDAILDAPVPEQDVEECDRDLPRPKVRDLDDFKLAKMLDKAKRLEAEAKALLSGLNLEIEAYTRELTTRLQDAEETFKKFKDGSSIGVNADVYPYVEDQAALLAWLKKEGLESLLTLNYQTMGSMVKERLEGKVQLADGEPVLPPGVNVFIKDRASYTAAKPPKS